MAEYLCEEDMNTGEYISRDLALRQLNATCSATSCDNYNGVRCRACAYADAMDFIDAIPAADVQPIKHGEWLKVSWNNYKCSLCDTQYAGMGAITFIYCPNCGANMRGDTE